MDFFSRLIGGHSKPSSSANNPRQRLAKFQQAYDRLLHTVQKSTSLHNDQAALESVRLSIQRLTTILHDESRSPAPHLSLSFASSNQLYLNVSRIASSAYNEPVIREAVAFFGALIDSEEEEFIENERFAQCLMNFVDRISGTSNVFVGAETEVEIVELLFGIAAKIRLQPEILPVWFRQRTTQSLVLQKEKEKEIQGFAGITQKEDFPLCYQLIDHVHHGGRIGDFARTGLLYVFESASKSDELEQWLVESDIPTLMASGLGALYSQMSRKLSILHPKLDMPIVLLLSDYPDVAPAPDAESIFSAEFTTHMATFLSYLQFWQDVLEHCNSIDVTQTLLDHFQVLFLQQLLYPSLLESSDADGGSSVAVLTYLRHILKSLEHPDLMHSMLRYLLAISSEADGIEREPSRSQRLLKRRTSLNLLANMNGKDDQMNPSLFSLIDLLMSSLRSTNPETVLAALRLISTILSKSHSQAFGTLIKVSVSHSKEPRRTHGALNAEMEAYLNLARGISNDDGLDQSYEDLLKDTARALELHTCSAQLLTFVELGSPPRYSTTAGSVHDQESRRYRLSAEDAMIRYLIQLVETFLTNNTEVNIGLTETILTITSCRHVLLEGLVAVEPSHYVFENASVDVESSIHSLSASALGLNVDDQPVASKDRTVALEYARRKPNWYRRHMPRLMAALDSAHAELASIKTNVPNFDTLFAARKQAFQLHDEITEAITNAPPPLPSKAVSTPLQSQTATPLPSRSRPDRLMSDAEAVTAGTPSKSNRLSGSNFASRLLGDGERSNSTDRTPGRSKSPSKLPRTPRQGSETRTPTAVSPSKDVRSLGSYGMIGAQSPRTPQPSSRALSPRPQPAVNESSQLLNDVIREADSEILARRFQLAAKPANAAEDTGADGAASPGASAASKATENGEKQAQGNREASLSHILTNAVILQSFELELVAMLQLRASMFGEVKFA